MTDPDTFPGGREMASRVLTHDWSATPLGPIGSWSPSRRSAVDMLLGNGLPMMALLGPELVQVYNDGYRAVMGERHPCGFGQAARACRPEAWDRNGPIYRRVLEGGAPALSAEAAEAGTFAFSYGPLHDDAGAIAGVLVIAVAAAGANETGLRIAEETARQRRLFQGAPGFIAVTLGPHHVFDFVNDAYVRLLGRTRFVGRALRDAVPDIEGQGFLEMIDRVFATGVPFVAEDVAVTLHRSAGMAERLYVDFVCSPTVDEAGAVTGTFTQGHDVTDAHRAREALRGTEEFNRRILASSDDRIEVLDLDANVTFMSEGGLRAMEASDPAAIHGRPWSDFWHGPEKAHAESAVARARAGGTGRFQGTAKTLAGNPRWWDVRVTSLTGIDGQPERLLAVSRDVTASRQAEDAPRELNARLKTNVEVRTAERDLLDRIVDTTDVMIMVCGLDFGILALNRANADEFERIYGVRPSVGDNMLDLLADQPEHRAQVRASWGRGLAGEEVTLVEAYGDPGRVPPVYKIKFRTLRDDSGRRVGCYQFVTDVSERVREQARLAEAEDAMRQSQKMEAVGQLTGGVAHDFNNLLTVIRASIDLLRRPNLPEPRRARYLDAVATTVDRAAKLTGQLLAFARRHTLKPEVFDAVERIRAVADMLDSVTGSRIDIAVDMPEGSWRVSADVSQFETALVNMAVNARDAMDGEGRITLRLVPDVTLPPIRGHAGGGRPFLAVSMADTGTGMTAATLTHVFEPFFTTKEVGKGTGLGLSQVFGFAKQSGGDIGVRSEPGRAPSSRSTCRRSRTPRLRTDRPSRRPAPCRPGTGGTS